MRQLFILACLWGPVMSLVLGCQGLPRLNPVDGPGSFSYQETCCRPFPQGKWQLLHTIETTFTGGNRGLLMGVTIVSSPDGSVHCILMTVEGLVLFDARFDGRININRGIPPFDSAGFAEGLLRDIRLVFFKPQSPVTRFGRLENGALVCRYGGAAEGWVDILLPGYGSQGDGSWGDGSWEIRAYRGDGRLTRTVKGAFSEKSSGMTQAGHGVLADKITLTAHGTPQYVLRMTLVEAVPLTP